MSRAIRRAQPWLGTMVEMGVFATEDFLAAQALAEAFAVVAQVHRLMSPQDPASDLARFHAAAVGEALHCNPHTVAVLLAARALAEASDGVFDPTVGTGGLTAWSLHTLQSAPTQPSPAMRGRAMPTFEALPCEAGEGWVGAAHAQEHRLRKNNPETRLDLGGIAKGYAVDCAVEALQARGIQQGWVNAGGDLRVWGGWDFPIHIRHRADASKATPLLALKDGAFATSVLPLSDGGSIHVSVAAPRCLWADALTKVVAYAPPALSQQLLARYDARPFIHPF